MRPPLALFLMLLSGALVLPAAEKTNDAVRLTGLTIHQGDRPYVEATGQVCLTNGILEFVAVEPKGRDYESLMTLDCRPSALQFALLLVGCETSAVPVAAQAPTHAASHLRIEVEWPVGAKTQRVPVGQWLMDRQTGKPPKDLDWVFTGSYFTKDFQGHRVFAADEEQAFIALWPQSSVLINPGGEFGNPYRGDQQGFAANPAAIPPVGTKIKLLLRPRRD